jgi:hypothetical protein
VYRVFLERDDTLFKAALSVHGPNYDPRWNAPTLHSSVQDQRYGGPVPYVNDMARGYGVLTYAQQSTSFAPATASITTPEHYRRPILFFFFHTERHDSIQQPEPESRRR